MLSTKFSVIPCLIISLLMASPLAASVKSITGQLSLMATLDGKPAFRAVTWSLTRSGTDTRTVKRHAAIVDLEPGNYQISVSMDNKTLTRSITIKESTKHSLIISLD